MTKVSATYLDRKRGFDQANLFPVDQTTPEAIQRTNTAAQAILDRGWGQSEGRGSCWR